MKKLYFLLLLCCMGITALAQVTVTIYATGTLPGSNITGSSTAAAYTEGDIFAGLGDATRGFAVFDLSSIPTGAIVGSVTVGYSVAAYTCVNTGACNTYGIAGNVYTSSLGAGFPGSLFTNIAMPANLISTQSYGASTGNHSITANIIGQNLVQDNEGGIVSIGFTDVAPDEYDITGETGTTTPGVGCAPYLTITYCTAPSVVTIYATGAPGSNITGSSTTTTYTEGDIMAGGGSGGFAVFDLSSIPPGSFIGSVFTGYNVVSHTGAGPFGACNTYGYGGNIGGLSGTPGLLYGSLVTGTTLTIGSNFGVVTGNQVIPSNLITQNFIQTYAGGIASVDFVNTGTDVYDITGETGTTTTTGDHAPYLQISYFAPPTAVTASAAPTPVCYSSPLTLTGTATAANMYAWTGPGGFTAEAQNPAFIATLASTGVYTLTASNGCGNDSASAAPVITNSVSVTAGPITGITNVWVGFTTQLTDAAVGGGFWTSSNTAIATVNGTGLVTGVLPGSVNISFNGATCTFTTQVNVVASVFTQIPTIVGSVLAFPLVAWYPFCADTLDKSSPAPGVGGGHDLINNTSVTAPATLTTDRFGIDSDAYSFNGQSTLMYFPTFFPVLTTGASLDFTYSVWMEADTAQNSIIEYNGNPNTDGFGFVMNDGAPWLAPSTSCNLYNPVAGNKVSVLFGGVGQFLSTPITLNQWHNLALKKNGNAYDFYIDDVSVGFFIALYNTMVTGDVFAIGGDFTATTSVLPKPLKAFSGKLDDIAIYNRQLSDPERDSLYNFNPDARPFTLGNDTTICSDSVTLFPLPPTAGNQYLWIAVAVNDTLSFDSSITISPIPGPAGNEYALQVGKPFGCFAHDTVKVYKSPIPINIGPGSVSICTGDSITLTDIVPHSALTHLLWNTGDTSSSITIHTSGYYSLTVDSVYHFTRLNDSGMTYEDSTVCVGRDTVHLHVYPVPIIGIPSQYTNCQGVPDTIRPYYDTAYTYLWNTGNTDSIQIADPIPGTPIVVYSVKVFDTGCFRIDTISVLIVYDTLTFLATDTAICLGQSWPPLPATVPPMLLVTNNFIANYQWTPTAGIPPALSNSPAPIITPDTSAEYVLTVTFPRCPDIVDSFHLDVQPNPIVYPGNNRSICQFDTIHIAADVTPSWYTHYTYSWTPSTELDASTTSTVVFSATDTTSVINMIVTVSTPLGPINTLGTCSAKDSLLIFVHPGRFMRDTPLIYNVCPGDSVQLMPYVDSTDFPGTILSAFNWTPGTYLNDSTSPDPWVRAITSLDYRLVGVSQFGCKDTLNYAFTVEPAASMYLPDSVTISTGESYLIDPQTNCVNFLWFPALTLDNIHSSTPIATPNVNTTYTVHASTEFGCPIVDSIKIRLNPKTVISMPNAFTPGANVNNKFMVIVNGAVDLKYFRIYDRWGNKVFETHNIEEGWDGTYNGKPQPFDVYVYEIEAEAIDGEVFQRVGNVTLLR